MKLSIVDRSGFLTDDLYVLAERRLLFALARFDSCIQGVSVIFSDANGARGGIDKICSITIKIRNATDVIISDQDSDVAACISRATARAGRAVTRAVARARHFDRRDAVAQREG